MPVSLWCISRVQHVQQRAPQSHQERLQEPGGGKVPAGPVQRPLGGQRRRQQALCLEQHPPQAQRGRQRSPRRETLSQKKGTIARETPAQDQALSQVDVHLLRDTTTSKQSFIILNHPKKKASHQEAKITQEQHFDGAICLNLDK